MLKKYLFLFLFVCSCSSNNDPKYCMNDSSFDINITSSYLSKINQKLLLDKIINYSDIDFNENSNFLIEINVDLRRNTALISTNNTIQTENLNFVVNYIIKDKNNKKNLDRGKIIIVDDLNISDNRFANYATDKYIMDNFAKNLAIRLESKVKSLLINRKCKKNQNQVAFYYFDVIIELKNTKVFHYV